MQLWIIPLLDAIESCSINILLSFIVLLFFTIFLSRVFNIKDRKRFMLEPAAIFLIIVFFIQFISFFRLDDILYFVLSSTQPFIVIIKGLALVIAITALLGEYTLVKKFELRLSEKVLLAVLVVTSICFSVIYKSMGTVCVASYSVVFSTMVRGSGLELFYYFLYSLIVLLPFFITFAIFYFLVGFLDKASPKLKKVLNHIICLVLLFLVVSILISS